MSAENGIMFLVVQNDKPKSAFPTPTDVAKNISAKVQ